MKINLTFSETFDRLYNVFLNWDKGIKNVYLGNI